MLCTFRTHPLNAPVMAVQTPPEKIEQYEALVATLENVERKGKTMLYTSLNGHMYSFLSKAGEMAIRLPEKPREEFLKKYNAKLSIQNGAVMKEYVEVPDEYCGLTDELATYMKISHAYVLSLKPKPTKK